MIGVALVDRRFVIFFFRNPRLDAFAPIDGACQFVYQSRRYRLAGLGNVGVAFLGDGFRFRRVFQRGLELGELKVDDLKLAVAALVDFLVRSVSVDQSRILSALLCNLAIFFDFQGRFFLRLFPEACGLLC